MKTQIIAEAGVNHNGDIRLAHELVEIAADAKADAIKFQTFNTQQLVTPHAEKAHYQKQQTADNESQFEMLKKLELTTNEYQQLFSFCQQQHIEFISTPFDLDSADFLLNNLKVKTVKVASGDITYGPLLLTLARSGCQIILSSGMSSLGEIEQALALIAFGMQHPNSHPNKECLQTVLSDDKSWDLLRENVQLLHCTSAYPAPIASVNLAVMDTLRQAFGLATGFSDHTVGIAIPTAAAARGADIIEKHFTINKNMPGPDHKASLDAYELKQMVTAIKDVNLAMGQAYKRPTCAEIDNKHCGRRSLVINTNIATGDTITAKHIHCLRPGHGISPMDYWQQLGKKADKPYTVGELL